jgi:peptide deformylase
MSIVKILTQDDPALSKICHPVTKFDERLWGLLEDMRDTLIESNGVGLAAPQIGIIRRVVLVINDQDEIMEIINPEIIEQRGEQEGFEGCLSVPGMSGVVKRPMYVKIKAQDRKGEWYEAEGTGLTARCFCHELAHLDGHLYTELCDRLYTNEELEQMMEEDDE